MGELPRVTSIGRHRDTHSDVHSACCEGLLPFFHQGDLSTWCWQRAVFVRSKATACDHRPLVKRRRSEGGFLFATILATTLAFTATTEVHAQVSAPARVWMPLSHVGAGITVGTMGTGLEAAVPYGAYWNIRVGVSYLAYSRTFHNGGSPFDAHLFLGGARLGADWFPHGGGFHVSLGVLVPNLTHTTANINLQPGKVITIEGAQYTTDAADPFRGSAHSGIASAGPLVSVGWGNLIPRNYHQRFSFPAELGAVYEGPPTVQVTTSGDICPADQGCRPASSDQVFNHNLATAVRDVNSTLDRYARFFPLISAGVGYRF
jgi:hypothetical protein